MLRRLFQIFFGFFAIILATTGIFIIILRYKLTDSNLYKTTLNDSGIFDEIDNIEKYFDADQDDVQLFLKPILNELDVKNTLRKTVFTNLDYLSKWINNKDDFYIFFPKEDLKNKITSQEFRNRVLDSFEENFSKLPTCANDSDLADFQAGVDGNYIPECKPSNFNQIFSESRAELENRLATILDNEDVVEKSLEEAGYSGIGEKTSKDTILNLIKSEDDKKSFENILDKAEKVALYTKILGFALIAISLLLTGLVVLASKNGVRNYIINFANVYLLTGFLVSIISGTIVFLIPVFSDLVQKQAKSDNLQVQDLFIKMIGVLEKILTNIFSTILYVGILIFLLFLLARVIIGFLHKTQEKSV